MSKISVNLNSKQIDSIKIAGTKFDRRCKLSDTDKNKMFRLRKNGKSINYIANKFGCSTTTVIYHTDAKFKEQANKNRMKYAFNCKTDYNDRINYKKELLEDGSVEFNLKVV